MFYGQGDMAKVTEPTKKCLEYFREAASGEKGMYDVSEHVKVLLIGALAAGKESETYVRYLKESVALVPGAFLDAHRLLAKHYEDQGQEQRAVDLATSTLLVNATQAGAYCARASALWSMDRFLDAAADYGDCIKYDPDQPPRTLFNQGSSLMLAGRHEEGVALRRRAHELVMDGWREHATASLAKKRRILRRWEADPRVKVLAFAQRHEMLSEYGRPEPQSVDPLGDLFQLGPKAFFTMRYREQFLYVAKFRNVYLEGEGGHLYTRDTYYANSHDHELDLAKDFRGMQEFDSEINYAAAITQQRSMGFYHWLAECVPRLMMVLPLMREHKKMKLVLPRGPMFVVDIVDLVFSREGWSMDRVVPYNPYETRLYVDQLYYPDWRVMDGRDDMYYFAPRSALELVRDYFVPDAAKTPATAAVSKVLYVERAGGKGRLVTNERDVLKVLREHYGKRLQVVDGSKLGMAKQIELFSTAQVVIGTHGGGLTNVIFARPNTTVVEFTLHGLHGRHFGHLSHALELDYRVVVTDHPTTYNDNLTVNVDRLSRTLVAVDDFRATMAADEAAAAAADEAAAAAKKARKHAKDDL